MDFTYQRKGAQEEIDRLRKTIDGLNTLEAALEHLDDEVAVYITVYSFRPSEVTIHIKPDVKPRPAIAHTIKALRSITSHREDGSQNWSRVITWDGKLTLNGRLVTWQGFEFNARLYNYPIPSKCKIVAKTTEQPAKTMTTYEMVCK